MPDDRYVLPPKEQAAKDRVYAYLCVHAAPIMDILHTMSLRETYQKLTSTPQAASMGKILWVVAVREIFDQTQPGGSSPVGSWESIDQMRMMAASDIRLQVADYVGDIWRDKQGEAVDCRIAINQFIRDGLRETGIEDSEPHFLTESMAVMMEAAMEGLIVAHECWGVDGLNPDEQRLRDALEENAEAYEPHNPWRKDDRKTIEEGTKSVVANFEKMIVGFRKEVEDGQGN